MSVHIDHLPAPLPEHLYHHADRLGAGIDVDFFERLQHLACLALAEDYFRSRDLEFVSFPAHGLDQDCQVQLAPPGDQECIGAVGFGNPQSDILAQLFKQALAQLARSAPATFPAGHRRGIDPKGHAHRRFFDPDRFQGNRVLRIGQRLTDGNALQSGQCHNLTRFSLLDFDALQALVDV